MREITKIVIILIAAVAVIGIAVGTGSARMSGFGGMMGGWQKDIAGWSDTSLTYCHGRTMGDCGYGSMMAGHGMMYRNGNQGAYCPYSANGASSTSGAYCTNSSPLTVRGW